MPAVETSKADQPSGAGLLFLEEGFQLAKDAFSRASGEKLLNVADVYFALDKLQNSPELVGGDLEAELCLDGLDWVCLQIFYEAGVFEQGLES